MAAPIGVMCHLFPGLNGELFGLFFKEISNAVLW